jgi:hypothetical protein
VVHGARAQRDLASGQTTWAALAEQRRASYSRLLETYRAFAEELAQHEDLYEQQRALLADESELPEWSRMEQRLIEHLMVYVTPQLVSWLWPNPLDRPNRQASSPGCVDARPGQSDRGCASKVQRVVAYAGTTPKYSLNNPPRSVPTNGHLEIGLADGKGL